MQSTEVHDDKFLQILWDEHSRIIGIKWKQATSSMTDDNFKDELGLFAAHVEQQKAPLILVDVCGFRHKMGPAVQEWRVNNISPRYNAAGVQRFAFLLPAGSKIPPTMNQASPGEKFVTRAFTDLESAVNWLSTGQVQHSAAD